MPTQLKQRKVTINGKRISIYFRTEREYQQKYREKLAAAERGAYALQHMTFASVVDEWQDTHDATLQHYTRQCYVAPVKDLLSWFGPQEIAEIRPRDLQDRLDQMGRAGYAYQTIKLRKNVLNMVYDYAVLNGYVQTNPVPALTVPRSAPHTPRELPPQDALRVIFDNVDKPLGMYYLLAACTGARRGEIMALTKADVDFSTNTITFNKVLILSNNTTPQVRPGTKTKAGNRTVPILPALRPILLDYVRALPGDYLFQLGDGPYLKWAFDKRTARYRALTGLDLTGHQLRHLYATICYDAGLDVKDTQQLLGHSKASTTLDIYTHIRDSRRQATDAALSAALDAALSAEAKK